MAGQITIPIVRDAEYQVGDLVDVEIDSVVQPDRVYLWPDATTRQAAIAGASVQDLIHRTLARFPAGDYSVRLRGVDAQGNAGIWSSVEVLEHRPLPEPPAALAIVSGQLQGQWVDE